MESTEAQHLEAERFHLRTSDLHWRAIDGEIIALEARGSHYLAANPTGALLWQALAEGATRAGLADELVDAYGIERDRALADVDAYLAQLVAQGLLER
jgi:Coenzyme PQQ synthesis protein D (PqqD)